MPANLTPDYLKAEQWFREATTTEEKILALERMMAVIPKHKGTDHMRAELRRKLSKLKEAPAKKGAGRQVDVFHIPRSGAGQITLIGVPNSGKSSILAALTNARVNVADFPFATSVPVPGMVEFENVQIQLVDTPPVTADFVSPGQVGTYRNCDIIGIVVDLSGDVEGQLRICVDFLETRQLLIREGISAVDGRGNILGRKGFCICTKTDIAQAGALEKVEALCGRRFEIIAISTKTKEGIMDLPGMCFRLLNIIRVYAKPPGREPDMQEPFTLPAGSTVMYLAQSIHRQLAEKLRTARIWGTGVRPGQNVQRTHMLKDKDIVELHFG